MLEKYAGVFKRFYASDTQLVTISNSKGYSDRGDTVTTPLALIQADIQPIGGDLAANEYGFSEECQARMFCEPNEHIKVGNYVTAEGRLYRIVYIASWTNPEVLLQFVKEAVSGD